MATRPRVDYPVPNPLSLTHSNLPGAPLLSKSLSDPYAQSTCHCVPSPLPFTSIEISHPPLSNQLCRGDGASHYRPQAAGLYFTWVCRKQCYSPKSRPPSEATWPGLVGGALLGACWLWRPLDPTVSGATYSLHPDFKEMGEGIKRGGTSPSFLGPSLWVHRASSLCSAPQHQLVSSPDLSLSPMPPPPLT